MMYTLRKIAFTFSCAILFCASAYAGAKEGEVAYNKGDYQTALREFGLAAEEGDAHSQVMLGKMYKLGLGIEKNTAESIKWFKKSADNGNHEAQIIMGINHERGNGVEKDFKEAFRYYLMAAKTGSHSAQCIIGIIYEEGRGGVPANERHAIDWFEKSAGKNIGETAYCAKKLGLRYYRGVGVERNVNKALRYLEQAVGQGLVELQLPLGSIYLRGEEVPQNFDKAIEFLRPATYRNDPEAMALLGEFYVSQISPKHSLGKFDEGQKLLFKSAQLGNANAQFLIGEDYWKNDMIDTAVEFLSKASVQGHPKAQYLLAGIYRLKSKYDEAFSLLVKSAESGFDKAQFSLGRIYSKGDGVAVNLNEAIKWYRQAASQGNDRAIGSLEYYYRTGEGVRKSHIKAYALCSIQEYVKPETCLNKYKLASSQMIKVNSLRKEMSKPGNLIKALDGFSS